VSFVSFKLLESVALRRDLPEHGLKAGDLGTIVELYPPKGDPRAGLEGVEVEFATLRGRTQAVVTLGLADIRHLTDDDLSAVRSLRPTE
jgi:hypothetical protein